MSIELPLLFNNVSYVDKSGIKQFWDECYNASGPGGKFFINISKRLSQSRFVGRNGEWSLPWEQKLIPGFEMLPYDPTFNLSFEQVTDNRALEIKARIQAGEKFAVMYSGGIDSTVILASLLKNLTQEELTKVAVCTSIHAVYEFPSFWMKYIVDKIKVIDSASNWYDDVISLGYVPITGDEGDAILGTQIGLNLYHNYDYYVSLIPNYDQRAILSKLKYSISDPTVHFTNYKDIIIKHLALDQSPEGLEFGRLLYLKYKKSVDTAVNAPPIQSLHDFFWWLIFDPKYLNCSVRASIYYNVTLPIRDVIDVQVNWFNGREYQLWSMNNNNNGQKIRKTVSSYKYAARKYIYDFDGDEWYFYFKTKLESLNNLAVKPKQRNFYGNEVIGVDCNYKPLVIQDPEVRDWFKERLVNYQIDWDHD